MCDTHHRHRREREREPPSNPSAGRIGEALDTLESHSLPGTPAVGAIRTVQDSVGLPVSVGYRTVKEASVTGGDPMHGALRSDDHVGHYEVVAPLWQFDGDRLEVPDECPECPSTWGYYRYSSHHHIAGSETVFCQLCEEKIAGEEWG